MSEITYKVHESGGLTMALRWVTEMVTRGLNGGPVMITLGRPTRSKEQNAKQWAMLEDIRKHQPEWHGHKMTTEDYKDLLTAAWRKQTLVPGIDGGFVALGVRTSKLNKTQFSDLIEFYYYAGTQWGVQWSEQALAVYEEYREVKTSNAA